MSGDVVARYRLTFKDLASKGLLGVSFKARQLSSCLTRATKCAAVTSTKIAGLGSALTATGASFGISKIVSTQRSFDILNSSLITATGSTEAAAKKFGELQKFAATTPYELSQSVEAFVKLKNLGLAPTMKNMTSFGNTASAMGKDLNQMIEAVADASTGEFERLKEFGIKASKQKNKVAFTFQGVTTTVKNNSQAIQKYLVAIGEKKFGGAMEKRMATLDGAFSNLGDTWNSLWLTISQSGFGDVIKSVVKSATVLLDKIKEYVIANKALIKVKLEEFVKPIIKFIDNIDFKEVVNSVVSFGNTTIDVFKGISEALNYLGGFKGIFKGIGFYYAIRGSATLTVALLKLPKAIKLVRVSAKLLKRDLLRSGLFKTLVGTLGLAKKAVLGLGSAVWTLTKALGSVGRFIAVGAWKALVGTLGMVAKTVRMVGMAIRLAFMANPIAVIITALAGLVAAGVAVYKNWDKIKEYWNSLTDLFNNSNDIFDGVWNVASKVFLDLAGLADGLLAEYIPFWSVIKEGFGKCFNAVADTVMSIWNGITNVIKGGINWIIKTINDALQMYNSVVDYLPGGDSAKIGLLKTLDLNTPKMSGITKSAIDTAQKTAETKAQLLNVKNEVKAEVEITKVPQGVETKVNQSQVYKSTNGYNNPITL